MRKRPEIHERIISGTHLLVVPSRFKPMSGWQRSLVYALFSGSALGFVIIPFKLQPSVPALVWGGSLLLAASALFLGYYLAVCGKERKNPLIVTDIGFTISPLHCATWDEIELWHFRSFLGLRRRTLSKAGEGTTLCIKAKTWRLKYNLGSDKNSIFAYQGYFFTEEQQAIWKKICAERNVLESDDIFIW